jgi:hypothetical protein
VSARKLWKVTQIGFPDVRPESKVKAYDIYVANARATYRMGTWRGRYVEVYVDERDGRGWQLYERIDLESIHAIGEAQS